MNNNENHRPIDPSAPQALTLRTAQNGASRGRQVLFIAASALGVAAMPGVAEQMLSTLGSALVSTAHAKGEEDACKPEVHEGYEEDVIYFLEKHEVELPEGVEKFISLFNLSYEYNATVLREREIVILITASGSVIPAPAGFYVFPDGIIVEVGAGGSIGGRWGTQANPGGGFWAMCQPQPGVWVQC